jgi:hypothetical protein
LASAFTRRPLACEFSRPLLEGRFRWPSDRDRWWAGSPRWRRIWPVALTTVGLIVVSKVCYVLSGVFDRRSGLCGVRPEAMVAAR